MRASATAPPPKKPARRLGFMTPTPLTVLVVLGVTAVCDKGTVVVVWMWVVVVDEVLPLLPEKVGMDVVMVTDEVPETVELVVVVEVLVSVV